ncbi:MAG: hypothetical protein NZM29_06620 [Nitrospira sp.]|nr:hypothetical protein [Nitrospira sp.]
MRIICAWCLQEGKVALLGEKVPLDDLRETHGICKAHQRALQLECKKSLLVVAGAKGKRPRFLVSRRSSS